MPSLSTPVALYQAYFVALGADDNIENCVKNLPRQQDHAGIEFGESQDSLKFLVINQSEIALLSCTCM